MSIFCSRSTPPRDLGAAADEILFPGPSQSPKPCASTLCNLIPRLSCLNPLLSRLHPRLNPAHRTVKSFRSRRSFISRRLKLTVRRHKFNNDSLSWAGPCKAFQFRRSLLTLGLTPLNPGLNPGQNLSPAPLNPRLNPGQNLVKQLGALAIPVSAEPLHPGLNGS